MRAYACMRVCACMRGLPAGARSRPPRCCTPSAVRGDAAARPQHSVCCFTPLCPRVRPQSGRGRGAGRSVPRLSSPGALFLASPRRALCSSPLLAGRSAPRPSPAPGARSPCIYCHAGPRTLDAGPAQAQQAPHPTSPAPHAMRLRRRLPARRLSRPAGGTHRRTRLVRGAPLVE
jgi:hypothetical protein